MRQVVTALHHVNDVLLVAIALVFLYQWHRRGGRPAGWLASAFSALAAITIASLLLPRHGDEDRGVLFKIALLCILVFPYLLFRFTAALTPPSRRLEFAASAMTVALMAGALPLPAPPRGGPDPLAFKIFVGLTLLQWTFLSLTVALRLWRAGGGQPVAVRYRMSGLSLGSVGLALAIVVSIPAPDRGSARALVGSLLVTVALALFYLSYSPPATLRERWRRPAQQALIAAVGDFTSATTFEQVSNALLPHVAKVMSATGVALVDDQEEVALTYGVTPEVNEVVRAAAGAPADRGLGALATVDVGQGRLLVWMSRYAPVFGATEQETLRTIGALADLALERIQVQALAVEESRRSDAFLGLVINNLPDTVTVKRAEDLSFVGFNRAAEQLYSKSREEVHGHGDEVLVPAAEVARRRVADHEALAGLDAVHVTEEEVHCEPGGARTMLTRRIPLLDLDGRPEFLVAISEDITKRLAAQSALERARLEADRANRAKSQFLSRMSHELRTPMNAVLGFAQLLEMDARPDQQESIRHIRRGGTHLLNLINEVLDISRIDSGQLTLSSEPVTVAQVIAESVELIAPLATARDISTTVEAGPILDSDVIADRQRFKQILLNLLSNAVKYNRQGGSVHVRCAVIEPEAGQVTGQLGISVQDNGPGIAQADLDRLFAPFDRLGAEKTDVEGTGVGLALSLRLAQAMSGDITVESELGQGTTFTVTLPRVLAPLPADGGLGELTESTWPSPQPVAGAAGAPERTLLYVEDNPSNVRLLERIVAHRPSWRLVHAANGRLGLDLARSLGMTQPNALVLLDLHLPDMHGYDVLRQLRADPTTADLPLVVLSADGTPGEASRLIAAGADRYLTKPLNVLDLLQVMDGVGNGERP